MHETYDVIVIGAGIAGLAAAREVGRKGCRVLLVEARSRVGGRIHGVAPARWPMPIELGAEFIHDGNDDLWSALKKAKVTSREVLDQHWLIRRGERERRPDVWDRIDAVMKKIGPKFRGSFQDWMQRYGDELSDDDRALAVTYVQGFQGAPLGQMSAQTLYQATKTEEEQLRPAQGYQPLIDSMLGALERVDVEVCLRQPVRVIRWKKGSAIVTAGRRRWQAKSVIVTVPLGVLQSPAGSAGALVFTPALKRKQRVIDELKCGDALRLVLRLRADAWKRGPIPPELRANNGKAFGFLHSEETMFPVWWSLAPAPILVGWTGGPAARAAAGWTPQKIYRVGRRTIARLLGVSEREVERIVVDWRTHDWAADPFTRGAYSFSAAGREDLPQQLAAPVAQTLFFAGEATAEPLELGTVQGALSSGRRAAREVLRVLRRD